MHRLLLGWILLWSLHCNGLIYPGNSDQDLPQLTDIKLVKVQYPSGERNAYGALRPGRPVPGRPVSLIVFFHGNGEAMVHMGGLARRLDRGQGLLFIEYPGYGIAQENSAGEEDLYRDAELVIQSVQKDYRITPAETAMFGRSLGTGVAVEMMVRKLAGRAVLVSPFTDMISVAEELTLPWLPNLLLSDDFDNLSKSRDMQYPILIVHGDRDSLIPVEMGMQLSKSFPKGRLLLVKGAGHNDIFTKLHPVEWNSMSDFVYGIDFPHGHAQ